MLAASLSGCLHGHGPGGRHRLLREHRLGARRVDPDTYGIPVVSSTVDFVGAFTLTVAIATLGLAAT